MMGKKTIVWAYILMLSLGTILSLYIPKDAVAAKDSIVIPGQAIRLRILANSDLNSDQALKREVRDRVNAKISVWVKDLTSFKEASKVIQSHLPELKATAEQVVKENGSHQSVKIKFGKVQFPTKLYGQFLYPAGEYKAVLITLGKGQGANWWCVLFPPLCFLDFSNGIAVSKGFDGQKTQPDQKSSKSEPNTKVTQGSKTVSADSKQQNQQNGTAANTIASKSNSAGAASSPSDTVSTPTSDASQNASTAASTDSSQNASTAAAPASGQNTSETHAKKPKKKTSVYVTADDQPIKVKFFALELFKKLF